MISQVWGYSLVSVLVVSLVSLVGVITLYVNIQRLKKILSYLISLAAGALIGDALIHLLPEVVEENGFTLTVSFWVLGGIVVSFVMEKIIHWRHCHHITNEEHPHPFAWINLIGDGVHNFIDGLIIAAAYMVDVNLGLVTTAAVILHEIPQEIGDFAVLVHGGFSRSKALFMNFLTALSAVFGTVVALLLGDVNGEIMLYLVPFAAGMFIYISCADLIPELHKEQHAGKSVLQLIAFILGIALMVGLLAFE
ncbi:MAG: ZIP family metal transporter [Patescibacteria group bacterium]